MKKSKHTNMICVLMLIIVAGLLTACGSTASSDITYNNLVDDESQKAFEQLCKDSGIPDANAAKVLASVKDYNDTIGDDLLTKNGTIDLSNPIPKYDDISIDEHWLAKNDVFIGYDCRLTAFELMKDFVDVKDTSDSNTSAIFMDLDALDNSKDGYFDDTERAKFESIYSAIGTDSSTDVNDQIKKQQEYWDKIGVKFNNGGQVSLISVYIHNHFSDEENELIVGHTGVLFDTGDGYEFFEKLSFQLPYQMIHFDSKESLKEYLMNAYDVDSTGECAKPFILENEHEM